MKINIIYWSGIGSTKRMAELIKEGVEEAGQEATIIKASDAVDKDVIEADIVFLGSPAMGAETIEEYVMEDFVVSIEDKVEGKRMGLFGSYDWGIGQWMQDWVIRMENCGAIVHGKGCINRAYPEAENEDKIREYARTLVSGESL